MLKIGIFLSLFTFVYGVVFIHPQLYYKEGICNVILSEHNYCYVYLPNNFKCLNIYSDYDEKCLIFEKKDKVNCWYKENKTDCILFDNKTKFISHLYNQRQSLSLLNAEFVKYIGLVSFIIIFFVFCSYVGKIPKSNTS